MSTSDPLQGSQPFNRLCDLAHVRKFQVGLRTGDHLHKDSRGNDWRDIVGVECKTPRSVVVETVINGDFQAASQRILGRLPSAGAPPR